MAGDGRMVESIRRTSRISADSAMSLAKRIPTGYDASVRRLLKRVAMEQRLDYPKLAPAATRAMYGLETYLAGCGLEHNLLDLVKIRASQINGCAFCIDMHTKDARARGETEQRIYALNAWRETPF